MRQSIVRVQLHGAVFELTLSIHLLVQEAVVGSRRVMAVEYV